MGWIATNGGSESSSTEPISLVDIGLYSYSSNYECWEDFLDLLELRVDLVVDTLSGLSDSPASSLSAFAFDLEVEAAEVVPWWDSF